MLLRFRALFSTDPHAHKSEAYWIEKAKRGGGEWGNRNPRLLHIPRILEHQQQKNRSHPEYLRDDDDDDHDSHLCIAHVASERSILQLRIF